MWAIDNIRFYSGTSMKGTFRPGDCLYLSYSSIKEIVPGDIVVFLQTNDLGEKKEMVHRVIAVSPQGLVTKGDNNKNPDAGFVTEKSLVGKVISCQRAGRVIRIHNGLSGLMRTRLLYAGRSLFVMVKKTFAPLYRMLRTSGLVARLWRPRITAIQLNTQKGILIKYIIAGRTAACYWPEHGIFQCKKPYDLVIKPPASRAEAESLLLKEKQL